VLKPQEPVKLALIKPVNTITTGDMYKMVHCATYFTHHHSQVVLSDFFPADGLDHWAPSHSLSAILCVYFSAGLQGIVASKGV